MASTHTPGSASNEGQDAIKVFQRDVVDIHFGETPPLRGAISHTAKANLAAALAIGAPTGTTQEDLFSKVKLSLPGKTISSIDDLPNIYKTGSQSEGLSQLITGIAGSNEGTLVHRGGSLVFTPHGQGKKAVHIPLFADDMNPGFSGRVSQSANEYMFKGGSTYSVPAGVGTIGGNDRLTKPTSFSETVYREINTAMKDQSDFSKLNKTIDQVVGATEDLFDNRLSFEMRTKNSAGMIDPMSYSGQPKLGRHLLGARNQIMLEVSQDSDLFKLMLEEDRLRQILITGYDPHTHAERFNSGEMRRELNTAQQAVTDHIERITKRGVPEGSSALGIDPLSERLKNFNFAWTPQSAESAFRPNLADGSRGKQRVYIKGTIEDVKNLTVLPGQETFEKGRQFHLSRAPIVLRDIKELPTAVAEIMGFSSETNELLKHEIRSARGGASISDDVAFGIRALGLQFADPVLNKAIFGDSGVVMSSELVKQLDLDPMTGMSRRTVSHKINLKELQILEDGTQEFLGFLRNDLVDAIGQHQQSMTSKVAGDQKVNFGSPIQLKALEYDLQVTADRKVRRSISAVGFDVQPAGIDKAVIGQGVARSEDVMVKDLRHANDMMNIVKQRGMDPDHTYVTGYRLIPGTGQLELIMAEGPHRTTGAPARTSVSAGHMVGSQRVSTSQVVGPTAVQAIVGQLTGIDSSGGQHFVMGDLGISVKGIKDMDRTKTGSGRWSSDAMKGVAEGFDFGFNETLLRNLAHIITETGSEVATQRLVDVMGGTSNQEIIGSGITTQIRGLGSKLERVTNEQFMKHLHEAAGGKDSLLFKELIEKTFHEVDVHEILKQLPAHQQEEVAGVLKSQAGSLNESLARVGLIGIKPTAPHMQYMMASLAAEVGTRAEEPMGSFGRSALSIKQRDLMMLAESVDFAHGQRMHPDRDPKTGELLEKRGGKYINPDTDQPYSNQRFHQKQISEKKGLIFNALSEANPAIFAKDHEMSLIYQQMRHFKETSFGFEALRKIGADGDLKTGDVSRLKFKGEGEAYGSGEIGPKRFRPKLAAGGIESEYGINQLRKRGASGKVNLEDIGKSLLGLVSSEGGVAKISDQAFLIQGEHGPMLVPSAKTMQFIEEQGFVRVSQGGRQFEKLADDAAAKLGSGQSAKVEAQSMYLDILESMETLRDSSADNRLAETSDIGKKLDKLYQVMAANTMAKQGLFYSSEIGAAGIQSGARMRLQTHSSLGKFQVGMTEEAFRSMHFTPGMDDGALDKLVEKAWAGKHYTTGVREPAAGGRQMFALQTVLLKDTALASADIVDDFEFKHTAYLNNMLIEFAAEGDLDKDAINLFRLASMDDSTMRGIHQGQIEMMDGILSNLKGSPDNEMARSLGLAGQTSFNYGDVNKLISQTADMTSEATVRQHTFESLIKIAGHGHSTPIVEGHFRARSYVDYMVTQLIDLQASGEGQSLLRTNLEARLDDAGIDRLSKFLGKASGIFTESVAGAGGPTRTASTYHYTDARNLIKYMFLKKAAHGVSGQEPAELILNALKAGSSQARSDMDHGSMGFMYDLIEGRSGTKAGDLIDQVSNNLLRAAEIIEPGTDGLFRKLHEMEPQTLSILQKLSGSGNDEQMRQLAHNLAKRMMFIEVMAQELQVGTRGTGLGMPFEGVVRNLSSVIGGLVNDNVFGASGIASLTMADFQGLSAMDTSGAGLNEVLSAEFHETMTRMRQNNVNIADYGPDNARVGGASVSSNASRSGMLSGEFFQNISRTKFFKPAAAVIGGLAGIEAVRSTLDRFSPGNVPVSMYNSSGTLPPVPVMSTPNDPTFNPNAMPNTRIARIARSEGKRSRLNVSGKMNAPADFRGMTNQYALHNGYVPKIQGSFRSELNGTMARSEIATDLRDRMDSVF